MRLPSFRRGDAPPGEDVPPVRRSEYLWLALVVLAAFVYHYLQARGRVTPWIFPDELRYTEIARAVADTGLPHVRGSEEWFGTLVAYLTAPAWLLDDPVAAWRASQAIVVAIFSLGAVPAFLIARRYVSSWWALVVSAASVLVPAAFYASTAMQEAVAYPLATTVVLLLLRALEGFSWSRGISLGGGLLVAAAARPQLVVLWVAAGVAIAVHAMTGSRVRGPAARRSLVGGVLAVVLGGAALVMTRPSASERMGTVLSHPGDSIAAAVHSLGALAVATGFVPAIALLALCARLRSPHLRVRTLSSVAVAFVAVFLAYVALKAASSSFAPLTMVEERNVIYLEPLAFLALAAVSVEVVGRVAPLIGGTIVAVAVATVPFAAAANSPILSENPGLSWIWSAADGPVDNASFGPALALVAVLCGISLWHAQVRRAALLAATVWTAIAGAFTYRGDHDFSRGFAASYLGPDRSWVDRDAGGHRVATVVAREDLDLNAIWSLGFWNRSITGYIDLGSSGTSLAGRVSGISTNGDIDPGAATAILHHAAQMIPGRRLGVSPRDPGLSLTVPDDPRVIPARVEGWYRDGWMGDTLLVGRYRVGPAGNVEADVAAAGGLTDRPRVVTAAILRLVDGAVVERPAGRWTLRDGEAATLGVAIGRKPVTVVFRVAPVVSPAAIGVGGDLRRLGLRVGAVRVPGIGTTG